ncbi:ECF transporter S component [Candidatus Bathyarchaeota archaeon]|nr:ECF transporter S component [Candidatus Bathyarchaeota archaeon]
MKKMVGRSSSLEIAFTIVFGALSVLLTLLKGFTTFPFPVLTYLKFEIAEIPCMVAYLAMGFKPGMASAIVYWLVLTPIGEFTPLGPAMKFAALASLILGMEAGRRLCGKNKSYMASVKTLSVSMVLGTIARVIVMSVFNYLVLVVLFPEFLDLASMMLKAAGLNAGTPANALITALTLTAVFNVIHSILSVLLPYLIVKTIVRLHPGLFRRTHRPTTA